VIIHTLRLRASRHTKEVCLIFFVYCNRFSRKRLQ